MPVSFDRLLGPSRRVDIAYPEFAADLTAPTAAELNNTAMVFNITCALLEADTTIGLADPETSDEITMCSIGNEVTKVGDNVEITLVGLRDGRRETAEVAGVLFNLIKTADVPLVIIDRVGYPSGTAYAADQVIDYYVVETDNPTRSIGDGETIKISQTPVFRGELNVGYEIAA